MRAGVFPGTISARKLLFDIGPTCASPELAAKGSANARTSEVTERCENAHERSAEGGISDRNICGRARTSDSMRSRAVRCSGREHACGGDTAA